jgi:putative ABC transport system permease protein
MGASFGHLIRILAQEHFVLVLIANVLAGPPAYWVMSLWLDNFVYKTAIGWDVFVLSGIITLVVSTVTVGLHSIKAARANPVEALKCE